MARKGWWLAVALVAGVLVVYQPVWRAGFIWDDDDHLTANPAMTAPHGLRMIWSSLDTSRYYPLTLTTFWIQRRFWGLNPMPYHLVNILLHVVNSFLLFLVLRRLRIPGAWLAAAIWAVHPVNVESVAWVTELKNTQSGFFFFLSVLCFLRFEAGRGPRWYAAALVCALAAMLSKPSTVVLPLVLLLCAWWERGGWKRVDIVRIGPFVGMAVGMSALTIIEQRGQVLRAGTTEWRLSVVERLFVAGRAVWFYAGKVLWPGRLTFVYPRWDVGASSWLSWAGVVGLMAVGVMLWRSRGRVWCRAVGFGGGYFLVALLPVLGFFDVFYFRYSFVADHFQYLASAGIIALAAGGGAVYCERSGSAGRTAGAMGAAILLVVLGILSWKQGRIYRDNETLWTDTIEKNPACWMAYNNLGLALHGAGKVHDAIASYQQSLRINGDDAEAHYNLGNSLVDLGKVDDAIAEYEQALRIQPDFASAQNRLAMELVRVGKTQDAIARYQRSLLTSRNPSETHYDFGNFLLEVGRVDDAIAEFEEVVRLRPNSVKAQNNLGVALARSGKIPEAMAHYQQALHIDPDDAEAHYNLGNAYQQLGDVPAAISQYEEAVWIDPHHAEAYNNLGNLLMQEGRVNDAVTEYQRAVEIPPDSAAAESNLGLALARLGNVRDAITHFRQALRIDPKHGEAHYNLGNALQQIGNVPDAIAQYQDALQIDPHDADAHDKLGLAFLSVGRFQEAADQLQEALRIKPDLAEAQTNLAWLVETKGVEPSTSAMPLRRSPN